MDVLSKYTLVVASLHPGFRDQLEQFYHHWKGDERVIAKMKQLKSSALESEPDKRSGVGSAQSFLDNERNRKLLWMYCILQTITPMRATRSPHFEQMRCYDERGRAIVQLDRVIQSGRHVKVFLGHYIESRERDRKTEKKSNDWSDQVKLKDGDTILVKLYSKENHTTEHEISVYRRLGEPRPYLPISAFLWNIPVLLMEKLRPLGEDDDAYEVGIQVLKQLQTLHQFTTHNDVKIKNVMRKRVLLDPASSRRERTSRRGKCTPRCKWQYLLIDFGGCPRETLQHGFRRRTWTAKWTCQPKGSNIITTPKHDLIELGTTVKALRCSCKSHVVSETMQRYDEYVKRMDDKHVVNDEDYRQLTRILSDGLH